MPRLQCVTVRSLASRTRAKRNRTSLNSTCQKEHPAAQQYPDHQKKPESWFLGFLKAKVTTSREAVASSALQLPYSTPPLIQTPGFPIHPDPSSNSY
ncbi:uncharacterized protein BDZ83DRAFT_601917 [Colletotrichum acutatum]|uniref:Uncharacterized protein n=1 Tax=Glomerella acutata TaxID=27357 RepID=A0AAD9D2J8_GLOAC|nr:uncharacterized protein BDZ83DRAFT_601917 [Colletotrichum acutatum]KAK1730661.1 hypothetical protein BDZ83DRAFT_601917 [Colletotrichum acutatum]